MTTRSESPYGGKPLTSYQRCHWKVRAWDKQGNASAWSEPAYWVVGLLAAGEWKSEWIGSDKLRDLKTEKPSLEGAKWICFPAEGEPPAGGQLLVTTWTLPADVVIKHAELTVTADDTCKFVINSELVATADNWKSAKIADATAPAQAGREQHSLRVTKRGSRPDRTDRQADRHDGRRQDFGVGDRRIVEEHGQPGAQNWHDRELDTS